MTTDTSGCRPVIITFLILMLIIACITGYVSYQYEKEQTLKQKIESDYAQHHKWWTEARFYNSQGELWDSAWLHVVKDSIVRHQPYDEDALKLTASQARWWFHKRDSIDSLYYAPILINIRKAHDRADGSYH